jgi:hypothetical protein
MGHDRSIRVSTLPWRRGKKPRIQFALYKHADNETFFRKLTWLVLGGDPAARSHRVEQFTAL